MDDDEISLNLADSDPALQKAGLLAALDRFKRPLLEFLKRSGATDTQDQEEILFETIQEVHLMAQRGKIDIDKSPAAIMFTVAKRQWIDRLRKRTRRLPQGDGYLNEVNNVLIDNGAVQRWYDLQKLGKTREIFKDFQNGVSSLPKRQAEVVTALALLFEANSEINVANIRDTIQLMTGETPPLPSIKSAWDAVRQMLKERIEKDL